MRSRDSSKAKVQKGNTRLLKPTLVFLIKGGDLILTYLPTHGAAHNTETIARKALPAFHKANNGFFWRRLFIFAFQLLCDAQVVLRPET